MDKRKQAKRKRREAEVKFSKLIHEYVSKHKGSRLDVETFGELLGYGRLTNTMPASNLPLRRKGAKFLGTALEQLRKDEPELSFQFWTLIHTRGHTSDREPKIDLAFFRSATDKTFRRLGLNAIYVIELQGLGNHPQKGEGRMIMVHVHAITWLEGELNFNSATAEIAKSKVWQNDLGAEPVCVCSVQPREGELEYLAYYLLKPPYEVKMLEERERGPRLKGSEKGYRPEFAARILECLSQIELKELVRSTNGGKVIRREWDRRLTFWHRSRRKWSKGQIPLSFYQDLWQRFRSKKRRCYYAPFTIQH